MKKEDLIADLKKKAQELYLEGNDEASQALMAKVRKTEGEMNDSLVCESCQ